MIAQIATDENVRLVDRKNGVKTGEDYMYVLTDPAATADQTQYRALMILNKREFEKMEDWAYENFVGMGELGPIVEINGVVSTYDGEASHARDALEDRGRSVTNDVVYVTPFFDGRDAALAKALKSAESQTGNVNAAAALVAMIGLGRLFIGRRIRLIRAGRAQAQ